VVELAEAAGPQPAEAAKSCLAERFPTKNFLSKVHGTYSGGPDLPKSRHVPERSCVACGVKMAKMQLVRVVRDTQGAVSVDATGRAPGRGAYLCRAPECWERAISKGTLKRSFGQDIASQDLELVQAYYQENIAPQATAQLSLDS
jgi:predicted RNA-binding protein YlxR (DUF448 family)